ncbi:tRNA pseudouridine(55) synthase TruB [Rhodococcus sp. BP-252]|uniref:tRNA pseudouridine(55) synthase TruB n=1 Tax=unclassified Rhodococcus (in: high G+C Gram-positive bacteria) TaxID=192944 RepID=UPI001C9B748E|nr:MULTISPECIES: tRNA pseudouridine(55) synthase TruB [unclassified Rhodococcus (in: high G+C Gram-positive bacteria)]MBY6411062.1 tRNA pseudouridine(55) synthase TruB [Rhodococcus sp. BP-320]MBY6415721.1 tRNA pseudouridine(55) synthase TruB [Rhodococcus sp. BP-321]MBY6420897.1 tRNA pseudouridine(55) synthase TruB [Rhodococcus sp. BP-324]MBY6425952.1 tRNA pseudouridine(55) synthase TruB [Rhodococcus sp. BP-323]MBY6430927.1 tRNA pseudouridine(55) synthase TruB [Rhodococcus sp. BP-322]
MSARGKLSSGLVGAGLLVVDKGQGVTSHDVVASCRKLLNTRKVGHAGTLDPMATGVLVLGVERATKMLGLLALTTKAYTATIRLGRTTTTDDAEGDTLADVDASAVTDDAIAAEIARLTGDIEQVPSSVSAIKVDGQRAHKLVRAGEEFTIPARRVSVTRFDVVARRDVEDGGFVDLDVEVDCSSGTYVRALARDLGAALGVGGHLTVLRRTRVGPFTLAHARTLEQLADEPGVSLDIDEAARTAFPHRQIDAAEAESISQGRWLDPIGMSGVYAAIDPSGHTIALLQEKGKRASSVMVVRPATLRGL